MIMYNTYMTHEIVRKKSLNEEEFEKTFEILKPNLEQIGVKVTPEDKISWAENMKKNLENDQFYFYFLYYDDEIVGYSMLYRYPDYLFLSEIQLHEKVKQTRAILYILQFLFAFHDFQNDDCLYFNILKSNRISNKTFSHLGGELIEEKETKNRYLIKREKVEKYLNKFNKK